MGDKFVKRNSISQSFSTPEFSEEKSVKEYNELLHLLANKNKILDELKYQCNNGKEVIPVIKIKKILNQDQ